jgi:hypothetical protein
MKKFFTLMAVAAIALVAQAAQFTVADGTDTNQYIPFRATYLNYPPYFGQVIYPASQLTEMEGKDITGMTFYIANENGNVMNGGELSFYLSVVDVSEFSDVSPFRIPESDMTLVKALPITPGETEIVVNFDTPFAYEGGNLALMVSVTQTGTFSGTGYFYGVNTDVPSAVYGGNSFFNERFCPKTTFTYEEGSGQTAVTLLAEANALEEDAEFMFNGDAVVTLQFGDYLFVRDNSGYGMICGTVDGTFNNGQVLNQGWTATKNSVNGGWVRFTDVASLSASGETNATLAAAQKLTGAVDESMINAYVYIENVKLGFFPPRSFTLPDGTVISKTEVLGGINWSAGGNYNIYGIICLVGGQLTLNPVALEKYVEPTFLRGDVNNDGMVTIADVTSLIDLILEGGTINNPAADCNLDGEITIADVTALIDYMLHGNWD